MLGIIVDGEGDYSAFRARYGAKIKVLKTNGPRGHTATEAAIAANSKKQVAMLYAMGCRVAALILDLESRNCDAQKFEESLEKAILRETGRPVLVVTADQMIENWILSDISHISKSKNYLRTIKTQKCFESMHGKNEIKKFFEKGYDYNEVKHATEMFPLIRSKEALQFSQSFKRMIHKLNLE